MKQIIKTTFVLIMFSFMSIFGQSPEKMTYQAVIRDASNALITNQAIGMQISILQGSASGSSVYVETQISTSNANGLVSIEIGTGSVVSGNFTTIDWGNNLFFIKTETDITGGTSYTISGTSQLLSVPYALHAKTASNAFSGDYNDLNNAPTNLSDFNNDTGFTIIPDGNATNDILSWNGTAWVSTNVCSLFTYYYADKDGDGFGDPFNTVFSCNQPTNYVVDNTDCDDNDTSINPNATEICDGIDNNCDGQIDEGLATITQYIDIDGDGFGDTSATGITTSCSLLNGYSLNNADCDDNDASINPNEIENPYDLKDNNCNGLVDECDNDAICNDSSWNIDNDPPYLCIGGVCVQSVTYYADSDGDGYGDNLNQILSGPNNTPIGYVTNSLDCNDNDFSINPSATDNTIDGIDQNCNGTDGV